MATKLSTPAAVGVVVVIVAALLGFIYTRRAGSGGTAAGGSPKAGSPEFQKFYNEQETKQKQMAKMRMRRPMRR